MDLNEVIAWVVTHGLSVLIGGAVLLLAYRLIRPAIHRVIPGVLHAQAAISDGTAPSDELGKRAATLEDLLEKLLRVGLFLGMVALVLAVFDLWSILAGIVLIIAAVTVASQDVVLDYVMGFLILVEGPYFKGDWITVGSAPGGMEGEVREIGLRRTVLRDATGAENSVSNGLIRASANTTRVFSVAVVEMQVLRASDVAPALAVVGRVSGELRTDAAWADRLITDVPTDTWVTGLGLDGASIRLLQRVRAGARMPVESELRVRLTAAFAAASIGAARWDTPMPILTGSSGPSRDATRPATAVDVQPDEPPKPAARRTRAKRPAEGTA